MFGLFKRKETLAERNKDKDNWALVVQSHGWILDRIDDHDPWFKTYWLDKEITVKAWENLFEGGKSHWSKISMSMRISNMGVIVNHQSSMMGINDGQKQWKEDFYGSDIKDFEKEILDDAAELPVFEYLEIVQEHYQASRARGELRSLCAEEQLEMLNFLKEKSLY